jgi:hypothetical protein
VFLVAFSEEPRREDLPVSTTRHGLPSVEAWRMVEVRSRPPSIDEIDGWRTGAFGIVAAEDLLSTNRLNAAQYCFTIAADVPDQPDLAYLQACWAAARWLIDSGCTTILDVHAARWHDGPAITALAGDRPFDFDREVKVIVETGDDDTLVHTRGMVKFARPDVLVPKRMTQPAFAAWVVHAVGERLAHGDVVPLNTVVRIDGLPRFRIYPYEPDVNARQVNLNNEGLLLIPDN